MIQTASQRQSWNTRNLLLLFTQDYEAAFRSGALFCKYIEDGTGRRCKVLLQLIVAERPATVAIVAMTARHALLAVLSLAAFCSKCCCLLCKLRLQAHHMPVLLFTQARLTYACSHAI